MTDDIMKSMLDKMAKDGLLKYNPETDTYDVTELGNKVFNNQEESSS